MRMSQIEVKVERSSDDIYDILALDDSKPDDIYDILALDDSQEEDVDESAGQNFTGFDGEPNFNSCLLLSRRRRVRYSDGHFAA